MKKSVGILLVLLCMLSGTLLSACGREQGEKTLTLEREANPTTGYEWSCEISDPEVVELVSQEYEADGKSEETAGGGGTEVFVFEGVKKGTATITLNYRRPWEETEEDIIEEIQVSVDADGNILQMD